MERITEAGAVFETDHRGCSAMRHHRHGSPFVTIVLRGAYVEVSDSVPELCNSGAIVVHDATEEHADRFASDTYCLNVELPRESGAAGLRGSVVLDRAPLRVAVGEVVATFYGHGRELGVAVAALQAALLRRSAEPVPERPDWLRNVIEAFPWEQPVSAARGRRNSRSARDAFQPRVPAPRRNDGERLSFARTDTAGVEVAANDDAAPYADRVERGV